MSIQLRGVLAATLLLLLPAVGARAQVVDDPLHGACSGAGSATCGADNGTITPLTGTTADLSGFGWTVSPGPQTGSLEIVVLIPTQLDVGISGLSISGTGISGSDPLHLFSTTPFEATSSSGPGQNPDLADYLGLTMSSPANKLGGIAVANDAGDTQFDVYVLNTLIGNDTLPSPGSTQCTTCAGLSDTYTLSGATGILPIGTDILGYLENPVGASGTTIATALSGQLMLQDRTPLVPQLFVSVPEPKTVLMFAPLMLGAFLLNRRRRKVTA